MNSLIGRRFVFGVVAVIAVSITSILLKYPAEVYVSLITGITGIFIVSQSVTDMKNGGGKNV